MVFFNYATMQMAAKIVYYGPGLCGKTTNLHHIYSKTSPQSRGEMVSLETETDRTLFFDLLPIDVGVIGGFKTRLQLYTIPGQVFYNTTRKLVLKGVDGIVFVADSQLAMLDANVESFKNLKENLAEIGLAIEELPLVLQLNKRDLPSIASVDALLDTLDPDRRYEWVEAVAAKGDGVFETLKTISKATLRTLRRRMTGAEEPARPGAGAQRRDSGAFRVRAGDEPSPTRTVAQSTPLPPVATAKIPAFNPGATASVAPAPEVAAPPGIAPVIAPPMPEPEPEIETIGESDEVFTDSTLARAADAVPDDIISSAPIAEAPLSAEALEQEELPPPTQYIPPPPSAPPPAPEPEVDFGQTEKPAAKPAEVKHVKVRSSVDIMAELEALRKRATTPKAAPAPKKEAPIEIPMPAPPAPRSAREVRRSVSLQANPGILARTRAVRLTVSFETDDGTMQTETESIQLDEAADVTSLSVDLKIV